MSIDLVCYSSLPTGVAKEILELMAARHRGMFAKRFLISDVRDLTHPNDYATSVGVEIAFEHGLKACCSFLVSLNDKSAADLMSAVEVIIKCAFGDANVLLLFNNEERR